MNTSIIIGNLGDFPKLTTTKTGKSIATMSVAVSWKKSGENASEGTE